jgi:hypothetical protein
MANEHESGSHHAPAGEGTGGGGGHGGGGPEIIKKFVEPLAPKEIVGGAADIFLENGGNAPMDIATGPIPDLFGAGGGGGGGGGGHGH